MKMSWLITKIFVLLVFLNLPLSGKEISLKIHPSVIEKSVKGGEDFSTMIYLENFGLKPLNLKSSLRDFSLNEDGELVVGQGIPAHSCTPWLDFSPKQLMIAPNQKADVLITAKVPFGVNGGNYSLLAFELADKASKGRNAINLSFTPGVIIVLTDRSTSKIDANLKDFEIQQTPNSTKLRVNCINKGNIHIRPTGSIVLFDENNKIVDRLPLVENNFILPNTNRIFTFLWNNPDKRKRNHMYSAECRFYVPGVSKAFLLRKDFSTFGY